MIMQFDLNHLYSSDNADKFWRVHPQDIIENFICVAGFCINDKLQIFAPTHATNAVIMNGIKVIFIWVYVNLNRVIIVWMLWLSQRIMHNFSIHIILRMYHVWISLCMMLYQGKY